MVIHIHIFQIIPTGLGKREEGEKEGREKREEGVKEGKGKREDGEKEREGPGPHIEQGLGPHIEQGLGPHIEQGPGPHIEQGLGPHIEQGLGPHIEQGPGPHIEQGPGPHIEHGPWPHIEQGPGPHIEQGPGPHVEQGPGPHIEQGPGPHVEQGPGPHIEQGPGPHVEQGPGPHIEQGPGPHVGQGPGPHIEQGPGPHVEQGPGPHIEQGPGPHVEQGPGPHRGGIGTTLRRNPKRKHCLRNHTNNTFPKDDDYIYCEECCKEWEGECPHHPLTLILDNPVVRDGSVSKRAYYTTPYPLTIGPSKIKSAGLGVWTDADLPKYLLFGPYQGNIISKVPSGKESGYAWKLRGVGSGVYSVDALNTAVSNWMRYVNCPRTHSETNLAAFQYKANIYYKTLTNIKRGTELMVWYGDDYAQELGVSLENFRAKPSTSKQGQKVIC
ncbi:hypothetical protein Pcinc_006666 [Petrolisthes cinctipes]|uniref:SET domain-containing protein n=1 Tax=Petrolisthes cinctipes TaxID=88211 RepID=A0AAE1GA78_PETCI|nr:hypothetical protein Pcinc_006666 [Petrolisthes cinctipes]